MKLLGPELQYNTVAGDCLLQKIRLCNKYFFVSLGYESVYLEICQSCSCPASWQKEGAGSLADCLDHFLQLFLEKALLTALV